MLRKTRERGQARQSSSPLDASIKSRGDADAPGYLLSRHLQRLTCPASYAAERDRKCIIPHALPEVTVTFPRRY